MWFLRYKNFLMCAGLYGHPVFMRNEKITQRFIHNQTIKQRLMRGKSE